MTSLLRLANGQAAPYSEAPEFSPEEFSSVVAAKVGEGLRISSLFGMRDGGETALVAALANDAKGALEICRTVVEDSYPAITPAAPQAHWFEREIAEQFGVVPEGHPWLKPIRFHHSYNPERDAWGRDRGRAIEPGVVNYFRVEGDEVHSVAVGPVHAGIIEPGHFRFQCHGENVFNLEIELGYQHRGVERALTGGPDRRTIHYMETLAGDTSVGHATAYAMIMEAFGGEAAPRRAQSIRAVALELERLANHTGDLGALANDVGYLPTAAFCGRLRGDFLNATGLLCGNRFGRGLLRPGGVNFDIDGDMASTLEKRVAKALAEVENAASLLWEAPSVLARFEDTGTVSAADAAALGLVGPAARASGLKMDSRIDLPWGAYRGREIKIATRDTGDVMGRARVRMKEIRASGQFIRDEIAGIETGNTTSKTAPPGGNMIAVSIVEGWRGEICHAAITDSAGKFRRYKVTDPSFHNWMGLAMALRNQQISDFPLCNKSFNLSYCGHDL